MTAMQLILAAVVALAVFGNSSSTPAHRPMGVTECHECLLDIHSNLTSASACQLGRSVSECLESCRPSFHPEVSLAVLVDLYGARNTKDCGETFSACESSAALCLETFIVESDDGAMSSSLNCENEAAKFSSLSCLNAAQMSNTGCDWNPSGIMRYIVEAGSKFLCDKTARCYERGNVFEPLDGSSYVQYALSDANRRFTMQCAPGTTFDTKTCSCQAL